ncbi:hypothetical protein D9M72_555090 [compost metagenome]
MVDRYIRSGRCDSISFTPAANTNSDSSALYTEGTGMPTMSSTLSMPFSSIVTWSDFSDEKQMPFILWPSSLRSLSLAVTTASLAPASANAASTVPARRYLGSFIITSWPSSRSKK